MSADELLKRYKSSYKIIVSQPTPKNINDIIQNDNGCLRQLGKGIYDSSYACKYCDLLGNLVDLRDGYPNTINILVGDLSGKTIIVESSDKAVIQSKDDPRVLKRFYDYESLFSNNYTNFTSDDEDTVTNIITVDPWVNDVIISWLLDNAYELAGLKHVIPPIGLFTCRNTNYKLRIQTGTPLQELVMNKDHAIEIIKQIAASLRIIRNYHFIHPYASINSLFYDTEPVSYEYHTINVNSPFTLYFGNLDWTSVQSDHYRIVPYARGHHVDVERTVHSLEPLVAIINNIKFNDEDEEFQSEKLFKIKSNKITSFVAMRLSGYPLYAGVYDFYSFLTSLLSWKEFRNIVDENIELQNCLNKFFPRKNCINSWPQPDNEPITCPYKIANILSNYYLYTDLFDRIINSFSDI